MTPGDTRDAYRIRPCGSMEDFQACVALQEEVWGNGFSERVPVAILKVALRLGGVVSGAWDREGRLAGFVFGMTGVEDGEPVHWSDMLAVRSGLRDAGLGFRLKTHQRELLLERGIRRAYWTFDPLESRNAHLNFARLGILVREYAVDMYGETDSPLHRGIGTDRFVALWLLDSERVRERMEGGGRPPAPRELEGVGAFEVATANGLPTPVAPHPPPEPDGRPLLVPVPARIQELKERSPETAVRWRSVTREVLGRYLDAGYEVKELVRGPGPDLSTYLLAPMAPS